jgi:hypothetical protein
MITMPPMQGTSNLAQQWEILQSYKEAFMSKEVLAAIVSFLADPLSQNARYAKIAVVVFCVHMHLVLELKKPVNLSNWC